MVGTQERAAVRGLVAALEDGVVAVDEAGRVVAVNDAALAALAPDRERDAVRDEPFENLLPAEDLPQPGGTADLSGPDGRRTHEARVSATPDVPGGVDRVVVLRDVTERARRVQRLEMLAGRLRHALRDEVTGALGRARYVRDAIVDAEVLSNAREAAEDVVDATADLSALGETAAAVDEVFGSRGTDTEAVDVVPVAEAVVEAAAEDHPGVKLDADLPASAPALVAGSLDRALEAVVDRACANDDAPVPRVDVTVARDGDEVVVEVADNGADDDGEWAVLAGDAGERGDLDLLLARWVVEASDGAVTVSGNVPRGSAVTVALPAADG